MSAMEFHSPVFAFPSNLCVMCGQPATEKLDFDASQEATRYFLVGRVETAKFGSVYQVPYCQTHWQMAQRMMKRIKRYSITNDIASLLLLISSIFLSFSLFRNYGEKDLIGSIILKVLGGILIGGFLLFPFEPLFRLINGMFMPIGMRKEEIEDLRQHLKAQGPGMPYTGSVSYLPGISVNYFIPEGMTVPTAKTIYVTSPEFAQETNLRTVGQVLLERANRDKTIKKRAVAKGNLVKYCSILQEKVELKKLPEYDTLVCDQSIQGSGNIAVCDQLCKRNIKQVMMLETVFKTKQLNETQRKNMETFLGLRDYTEER